MNSCILLNVNKYIWHIVNVKALTNGTLLCMCDIDAYVKNIFTLISLLHCFAIRRLLFL